MYSTYFLILTFDLLLIYGTFCKGEEAEQEDDTDFSKIMTVKTPVTKKVAQIQGRGKWLLSVTDDDEVIGSQMQKQADPNGENKLVFILEQL